MSELEKLLYVNSLLLEKVPNYRKEALDHTVTVMDQFSLMRALISICVDVPTERKYYKVQDDILQSYLMKKRIVRVPHLIPTMENKQIFLFKGDITTLKVDAIVNAANSGMLGCLVPYHRSIDNAIHFAAGLQLRRECMKIMEKREEDNIISNIMLTKGYNLACKHIIHAVAPVFDCNYTKKDLKLLRDCYRDCLMLAIDKKFKSIAFCCLTEGDCSCSKDLLCSVAIETIRQVLKETNSKIKIIFCILKENDYIVYKDLLY